MRIIVILFIIFFGFQSQAQIETPRKTVKFEAEIPTPAPSEKPTGLELPKINLPRLIEEKDPKFELKDSNLGKEEERPLDITQGDGLQDYTTNKGPKYFTKDAPNANKNWQTEFARDQNLGNVKVSYTNVNIKYRDHQAEDGDMIMILVNDDIVRASVTLYNGFQGFDLPLADGENKVEFVALNQGQSGPNTAELHVYDTQGRLVSAKEWNLLTGYRATFVVIKE